MCVKSAVLLAVPLFLMEPTTAECSVRDLVNAAQLVVAANGTVLAQTDTRVEFELHVSRVFKGDVPVGATVPASLALRPGLPPFARPGSQDCGLWFLTNQDGVWQVIPVNGTLLSSTHFPLPSCAGGTVDRSDATSTVDEVVAELASAAEFFHGGRNYGATLFDALGPADSPLMPGIVKRFSESTERDLKAIGLSWRIAQGDAGALELLAGDLVRFEGAPALGPLASVLSNYTNPDPAGVRALGKLALAPGTAGLAYIRQAAVDALRALHTRDALPYLFELLDSPDPHFRSQAVAGFSLFFAEVPITRQGPETEAARERALNPARRASREKAPDEEFIHLGGFKDSADEARYLDHWKGWWQLNKSRLGY